MSIVLWCLIETHLSKSLRAFVVAFELEGPSIEGLLKSLTLFCLSPSNSVTTFLLSLSIA